MDSWSLALSFRLSPTLNSRFQRQQELLVKRNPGDYKTARAMLEKAVAVDELVDHESPLKNAGDALKALTRGRPFEAQKAAQALVGLRGNSVERNPILHTMLAMAQWQLGDHELARETLSKIPEPPTEFTKTGPQTRRLQAEARALIGGSAPDTRAESP